MTTEQKDSLMFHKDVRETWEQALAEAERSTYLRAEGIRFIDVDENHFEIVFDIEQQMSFLFAFFRWFGVLMEQETQRKANELA